MPPPGLARRLTAEGVGTGFLVAAVVGSGIAAQRLSPNEIVRAADVVITMGCGDACPIFPGKRYEDWLLDDPAGLDLDAVRPIRDEIGRRVKGLLDNLASPQT